MDTAACKNFQEIVWQYYNEHGRHDLPWRSSSFTRNFDPYAIMVSELMLQQTQVARVIPKYQAFMERFPNVQSLAAAELGEVLALWSGLGYNRRAKFLHQAARMVQHDYQGVFPQSVAELVALPGVGVNTAGAIAAYAYNSPAVFIETNIRTVYIHHFYQDRTDVADTAVRELVEATLDTEHTREWYWALMDYGAFIKQTVGNLSKLSTAYTKQSRFEGSRRQVRGAVLRALTERSLTRKVLAEQIPDERLGAVLDDLLAEGLIRLDVDRYLL